MLRISPDLNVVVSILESGDLLDKDFIYLNLATTKKKVQTDTLVTAEWMFFFGKNTGITNHYVSAIMVSNTPIFGGNWTSKETV